MSVTTLRPNGTTANGDSSVTGAASRHAALNDDDLNSYVTFSGTDSLVLALDNWSQPSGSVVVAVYPRFTYAASSGTLLIVTLEVGTVSEEKDAFLPATFASTQGLPFGSVDWDSTPADFEISVAQGLGTLTLYELFVDVYYVTKPSVSVTAPTSTIGENQPTVAWGPTFDALANAQRRVEIKVYTDAQYGAGGFDPDTSTATTSYSEENTVWTISESWQVDQVLPNDTYRAYVRMASWENGEWHWSDWDYETFTVDADIPGDPSLTLTAQSAQGRIRAEVDDTSGNVSTDAFFLESSLDQTTWTPVRHTAARIETDGSAQTVYDLEAPNGVTVYYRVRAYNDTEDTYSGWTTDNAVWSSNESWIKHPFDPTLALKVKFKSAPGYSREQRKTSLQGLNAEYAYVIRDTAGPKRGTLELWLFDPDDRDLLDALVYAGTPLLVQGSADMDWDQRWVEFMDSHDRNKAIDQGWSFVTAEVFQWQEMPRPEGLLLSEPAAGDNDDEDLLLI